MENKTREESRGWLGFFIISLIFINPIFNLFLVFTEESDIFSYIGVAGFIALSILSGIFLYRKTPYAVTFTKIVLIVTFIGNIVVSFISKDFKIIYYTYFLIWIPYLYKSKQVKGIFGNLKEKKSGYQIWPIMALIFAIPVPEFGIVSGIIALYKISRNNRLKGFWLAITAIFLAFVTYGTLFYLGFMSAFTSSEPSDIPQQVNAACITFCFVTDESSLYWVDYDLIAEKYMCNCQSRQAQLIKQKNFTISWQVSPAYFTELNNASAYYNEGIILYEEGTAYLESAFDNFEEGWYRITVTDCIEATLKFKNASESLSQAEFFYDKSKSYAPDNYNFNYASYYAKASELSVNMITALLNACDDLTQAAKYYSIDSISEGSERLSRYEERLLIYAEVWNEYNQTVALANKALMDSIVVYIPP